MGDLLTDMADRRLAELTDETARLASARLGGSHRPGRLTGRFLKALWHAARGNPDFAEQRRWIEAPLIKTAIGAHSTNDTSSFYPVGQDLQLLVAKISGMRWLQGFRTVPDNTNCVSESSGAVAYWGDQGQAAAMSALSVARSSLAGQRVNALSAVTRELAEATDSEMIIAADHARAISEKLDSTFFDPANQGSPEILPKSITADAPGFFSSGSAVAQVDTDLRLLVESLVNGGSNLLNAAWVMNPITGAYLGSLRGSGGGVCYPNMGALGGTLLGLPAICTAGIARSGSPSPGTSYLCLVDASRVWLVDSGLTFRASKHSSVQMVDGPTNNSVTPTATTQVSMWQTESLALLSTAWLNWKAVTNASAAAVLLNVEY